MRQFFRYILCGFSIILLTSVFCKAQITINGTVTDIESKENLSFASVWEKGTNNAVITQLDGTFSITIKANDTIVISVLGYKDYEITGQKTNNNNLVIEMIPSAIQIEAVTIKPGKNPAIPIVKNAIRNRKNNRPDAIKNIELIEYNKLNFSLSGIDKSIFNIGFMQKHPDILIKTNEYDDTWNIPLYFSEYMNYEKREENKPPFIKEIVKNQHGSSFIESDIVSEYIASLNADMTFYGNLRFLQKDFISPISTQALLFYRYYLDDSLVNNGRTYYHIRYKPRNSQDLAFFGYMIIEKETGTLTEIDATLQPSSNLNFVRRMHLFEKLQLTTDNKSWFRRQQKMQVEFVPDLSKDTAYHVVNTPLTAIKSTTYIIDSTQIKDFVENQTVPRRFNLKKTATTLKDTSFLNQYRPDTLSSLDIITQKAITTSNDIPLVKVSNKLLDMFLYGYLTIWKVDIGPYLYFIQNNKIEGTRLNLSLRTSEAFHDKMLFGGYIGYGCRDNKFKYGFQYFLKVTDQKYGAIHFKYDQNIYRIGDFRQNLDFIRENVLVQSDDNLLTAILTKTENGAVYFVKRGLIDWEQQISQNVILKPSYSFTLHSNPPFYPYELTNSTSTLTDFSTNELGFNIRLSFKESSSTNHFRRLYIDSRYPICHFNVLYGKYAMADQNDTYLQLRFVLKHNILVGVGRLNYVLEAGYINNPVPYPLLEIHRGNETSGSGEYYFNHMKYMEFASDAFVNLYTEYHMTGFLFNKIWGLKKLQLRELLTFKACYGRMLNDNGSIMTLPNCTYELSEPYMEAGIGVTNLMKFIRLEYIWRLNYLNHPDITKKGLFIRFNFEF